MTIGCEKKFNGQKLIYFLQVQDFDGVFHVAKFFGKIGILICDGIKLLPKKLQITSRSLISSRVVLAKR